ncbi:MAG: hypothetical protein IKP82_06210, partial [Oscillospiraceae bacterium]|nr:hypothetical protein [Oscillospiraceae bacterium]
MEMTATVGVCERFYRQQAVRFSLFRHPPRGGSADATFPRWGIGVKLTITGDFKQSKQQKQAKSKDVFALKK